MVTPAQVVFGMVLMAQRQTACPPVTYVFGHHRPIAQPYKNVFDRQ